MKPIIEVDRVTKTFRGGVRALDRLSLTVEAGAVHGLLGPNGAGKTTLIRVLTTLMAPDSGQAYVDGIDVRKNPAGVRGVIGLAGQYAAVDGYLTGRENVEMIGRLYGLRAGESRRRSIDVLEKISLTGAADRQVKTYSGGMRRRLDLAASLVGSPRVLLLDEPTTGLDPAGRRDLWELIRVLKQDGATVLLTTQYLDEADQLADRVTVIDEGRVIDTGTPGELKATVGDATVELTVDPARRGHVLEVLGDLAARGDTTSGDTVLVPATEGTATLRRVLFLLDSAGLTPDDITLRKPTLDDVFLTLTGHRAVATTEGEAA